MDSYGDGLPLLLRYQARWNAETAAVAFCEKSRRIGLSWGDASESAIYAGTAGRDGGTVYYMSYNRDMTEGYIQDCLGWARFYDQACGEVEEALIEDESGKTVSRFRLHFASGHMVQALPGLPRSIRSKGRPGEKLIVDEAAYCDDIDGVLKAALAFTQWGGKVRVISTHNGEDNPFHVWVGDIRAGRYPDYALHRITLDDAIADGLHVRIGTVTGRRLRAEEFRDEQYRKYKRREDADEELGCVPRASGGPYFSRALVESRMREAPIERFDGTKAFNALPEPERAAEMEDWIAARAAPLLGGLDPLRRHVFGMDFGRSGDLSVIAPLEIGETLGRACPWMIEMRNTPHAQQVQAVRAVGLGLPRFGGAALDASGNGSYVAEAAADAFGPDIVDQVHPSQAWHLERWPRYRARLQDGEMTIPKSDDLLGDHRAVVLVRGVPKIPPGKTDKKGERHGDGAMALLLADTAADRFDGAGIEFTRLPGRMEGARDPWARAVTDADITAKAVRFISGSPVAIRREMERYRHGQ